MSIFTKILRRLFCHEDEQEKNDHASYNRLPGNTGFHAHYYDHETSYRNRLPSVNPSSPSPKLSISSSNPPQSLTSSSKVKQSSCVDTYASFPRPSPSPSKLPQSTSSNPSSSFSRSPTYSSKPPQSSSVDSYSAFPKPPISSSKLPQPIFLNPSSSSPKPPTSSSKPLLTKEPLPQASSKPHPSSPKAPTSSKPSPSSPIGSPFSSGPPVPSTKLPPTFKSVLSPTSSNVHQKGKTNYVQVQKDPLPIFAIPEYIKDSIKNDIVPKVLNQPLSPSTYKDYFAALLYAEEFYHEKWPHFDLENMTLELEEAAVYKNPETEENTFVKLKIDTVPKERPFLLSRDLVYVRPAGTKVEHFQGIIHRIVRSRLVLVEFEDDFYVYHDPTQKYDISFSFNRVCFKRAHQAVQTASDALFRNFLFPDCISRTSIPTVPELLPTRYKLDANQLSAVRHILSIQGSPPYLVAGQHTREVVSEAVHQLYRTSLENRILICAPSNGCCDGVMRSLLKVIPESDMFRANAAFREKDEVPEDILPSCLYKESYFSCPPIEKLRKFRVIFSTFMSSFRLHDKGLTAGHFSHVIMVDASSAIEPETAVTLTNFAVKNTTVVVTGEPSDRSRWVRADIARQNGLRISYFERLFKSELYRTRNPMLITQLDLSNNSWH